MSTKRVLLVYSGGLDTSICIPMMREEYGYDEVVTVTVDVGQDPADIEQAASKAHLLKTKHFTVDAKEEFVRDFCWPSVRANGDYQGYPMSTSIARPLIAVRAVELARELNITSFAHGCTGKGNDQFRIEFGIRALMPEATIHAPIRERNLTRSWEINYAQEKAIPVQQSLTKIWSVDENLWGRSIEGGRLEQPDYNPPEEIFKWTRSSEDAEKEPAKIKLEFKNGVPVSLDGRPLSPAELVSEANRLAGRHAIGRIDVMEDRMMGLKVRENYECPGATLILRAHKSLENLVLTRDEIRMKALVDQEWSRLAYEGLWWDPLKEDLEAFIESTQKRVTGEVELRLHRGQLSVIGRSSPWALYSEDLASFDSQTMDQRESSGWVKNFGLQSRMYATVRQKMAKEL